MKYTKILSLLAAASMAVSPASMTVYAEGDNTNDKPAQTEQTPPEEVATTTTTTAAATTEITTTAEVTTTTADTATSTTKPTTTATKKVTTTTKPQTTTTTTATTTEPVTTTATTTSPADNVVIVKPVCEHIIKSDINGELHISVPKDATAKVDVVYESPEYDKHEYYNTTLNGGMTYSLAIEGRDTTADDYRNYTVSVSLTGGKYNMTSDVYSDKFNILDKNDNPDSYRIIKYNFTVDDKISKESFTVTKNEQNEKEIVVHLNSVMLGDVNEDSTIDSIDATAILVEYANTSTGNKPTFTSSQIIAADVNKDGFVNSTDASKILAYYAESATGGKPSWD
jgi:hypothetical protein